MLTLQQFYGKLSRDNDGEYCLGESYWCNGDIVAVLSFGAFDEYDDAYGPEDCEEALQLVLELWETITGKELEVDDYFNCIFFGEGSRDTIELFVEEGGLDVLTEAHGDSEWREILKEVID